MKHEKDYGLTNSAAVISTSEAGDRMAAKEAIRFTRREAEGPRVVVHPDRLRQTLDGIGTSFTESSAFVLAHLSPEKRGELMRMLFGREEDGAGFSLTRTHIGSCDFCVEGRYSYRDREEDAFSIAPDRDGFRDEAAYPKVRDRSYDLLPMIKEALAIDPSIRLIASAWTAPPWMKDLGDWFQPGHADEKGAWVGGTGGRLLPVHHATFADYVRRYVEAYAGEGVSIWAVTPVNEPLGNGGSWESMHFTAPEEAAFVRDHLGPALADRGVRILPYDQNRGEELKVWADAIYDDPRTAVHVHGMAVHWYSSTVDARTESLDYVHAKAPDKTIIHTEGCIDCLGVPAPGGVGDPDGYEEKGWWMNDAFWWNDEATDWAYTVDWGDWVDAADHPRYTPVHRYARNIIDSLNHWVSGWVDWNIVLDRRGGPNHVGNFCGAPIMIDTEAENPDEAIHVTPVYTTLAQFSRHIRPGDRVVESRVADVDGLHALATLSGEDTLILHLLNTTREPLACDLRIGTDTAELRMDANSLRTITIPLGR